MKNDIVNPPGWPRPSGYSHAVVAEGRFIFASGQLGWDNVDQELDDDFTTQVGQALRNVADLLYEAGSDPGKIVRMTWYVLDKGEYTEGRKKVGRLYREIIGDHYPAMTLIEVKGLLPDGAKVEIEVTAAA